MDLRRRLDRRVLILRPTVSSCWLRPVAMRSRAAGSSWWVGTRPMETGRPVVVEEERVEVRSTSLLGRERYVGERGPEAGGDWGSRSVIVAVGSSSRC